MLSCIRAAWARARNSVRPDDRFVDAGGVITAAGVSAGIDMALHLVRRLHSEERAREVRRYIQYDPEPPV
jgi:transcriptional regulator GlxA family with amidase domain